MKLTNQIQKAAFAESIAAYNKELEIDMLE